FSLSCFILYLSRHHRVLHSFPTRRSSDLACSTVSPVVFLMSSFVGPSSITLPHPTASRSSEAAPSAQSVVLISRQSFARARDCRSHAGSSTDRHRTSFRLLPPFRRRRLLCRRCRHRRDPHPPSWFRCRVRRTR